MLINPTLTAAIDKLQIDPGFEKCMVVAYENFCKQVMMELTFFSYSPEKYGFPMLGLVSKEYALQKYFEPRLETYIRQYLFTALFESALEYKGYDVYTPTYTVPENQYIDGEVFCSNKDFEDNAGFEIVINDGNQLTGCRFNDIHAWDASRYYNSGLVNKILIIDWYNSAVIAEEEIQRRTYGIHGDISLITIDQFVASWVGIQESKAYVLFVKAAVQEYQEIIGISSMPKLTAPMLFEHRIQEEQEIKNSVKELIAITIKNKSHELTQTERELLEYRIIDPYNYKTKDEIRLSSNVEVRSRNFLIHSDVLASFDNERLFRALVGKTDFAKSFLTSEYLFKQYSKSDLFDYTAIVSGYLKSIEQLLMALIFQYADQGFRIKSNGKKDKDGKFPTSSRQEGKVFKIDLTTQEMDFADTTIGSLIYFLKEYKNYVLRIDQTYQGFLIDFLECYRIECRNDSFHKHNNYDWCKVLTIRHNTLLLYYMLLGSFRFKEDIDVKDTLGIICDDSLEYIYYWMRKERMYTFKIKIPGDDEFYIATREVEEAFPSFDSNGLLRDNFSIKLRCSKESSKQKTDCYYTITRDSIPEKIWYSTFTNEYPIEFNT